MTYKDQFLQYCSRLKSQSRPLSTDQISKLRALSNLVVKEAEEAALADQLEVLHHNITLLSMRSRINHLKELTHA